MRYGYGYGLDVKNGFRFFLTQVPGYSADYDKTRGDSVFVDNTNNTMEVNNLQEGLTPTQYHGQKASVLDGSTQYWSKALPTNVLTGTQNDFVSAGTLPSGFSASGATWNQTGILGSTSTNVLKLTGTNAYAMFTGLTVGKKYKLKVRWFGDNTLRIGSTSTGSDYTTISATTQWNRVERTFTATAASISLSIASGTVYIDILNFTEDWKLDLNESHELIRHSMNRDFEQTLGTELNSGTVIIGKKYIVTAGTVEGNSVGTEFLAVTNATTLSASNKVREIPNLVTNGSLDSNANGWTLTAGIAYDGINHCIDVNVTGTGNFFQSFNFVVGKRYRASFEIKNYVSGDVGYKANNTVPSTFFNSNGVKSFDWTQTVAYTYATIESKSTGFVGKIDNIHIYEISDYAPSVNAQVSGNNHYCQISSLDKQGTTGTQSLRITAGGAGRGIELLSNPNITGSATGWTIANPAVVVYGNDNLICTNLNNSSTLKPTSAIVTSGKVYEIIYTVTVTSGNIAMVAGVGATGRVPRTTSGTYRELQTCVNTGDFYLDGTAFYGTIERLSVKEYLGEVSLPAAQIDTLVAGNKYTKEFWARLDPASLSYGSNLITSWVDSNANGVIDIVNNNNPTYFADKTPSVKTAGTNGFSGIAQRIELASGSGLNIWLNGIIPNTRVYKVVFKYRSSKSVTVQQGGNVVATLGANTGNAIESTAYISQALGNESSIRFVSTTSTVGDYLEIGDISLYEATPIAITSQIGTKPVTVTPSVLTFTKIVLNFEATASEVGQDIKFYLNGAGSVYVDNLSLTQAYDVATAMNHKYSDVNKVSDMNSYNGHGYILRAGSFIVRDFVTTVISSAGITSVINTWESILGVFNRTNSLTAYKNGTLQNSDADFNKIGKLILITPFVIGNNIGTSNRTQGIISQSQIIRFTNISQSNFNPNTYKPGDAITGGGVEIVLWQDWSNVSGGTAYDKYRPETTVRNDLTAYGTPHAGNNVVTIKDYSPQTKKLRQGTQSKQPIFSSTEGFDFDGTDDILEAGASLGSIKTVILKLKADNLELAQDILQLSAAAKLTLNTDGTITATGWTSPTVKIQNTLLADSAITANNDFLVAVKSNTAITADAFKLGGSTTFFNGKIRKVVVFTTTLDDPTIQKIFKSIRSM